MSFSSFTDPLRFIWVKIISDSNPTTNATFVVLKMVAEFFGEGIFFGKDLKTRDVGGE